MDIMFSRTYSVSWFPKKNAGDVFLNTPPASAVGLDFTFMGRTSALPTILSRCKGTTILRNCKI